MSLTRNHTDIVNAGWKLKAEFTFIANDKAIFIYIFYFAKKIYIYSSVANSGEALAEILCLALSTTFKMQRNESK